MMLEVEDTFIKSDILYWKVNNNVLVVAQRGLLNFLKILYLLSEVYVFMWLMCN